MVIEESWPTSVGMLTSSTRAHSRTHMHIIETYTVLLIVITREKLSGKMERESERYRNIKLLV